MEKLAKALREWQGDRSLRVAAFELGVAHGTFESWVKGWRKPDLKNVPTIAREIGEPVEQVILWLVEDDEPPIIDATSSWFHGPIDAYASQTRLRVA